MDKLKEQECASIGRKIALWCALPAALVFLGVMVYLYVYLSLEQQERQRQNLVAGLLYFGVLTPVILGTLYLSAAFLGRMAGKLIYRRMRGFAGAAFVGICWALGCYMSVAVVWFIFFLIVAATSDSTVPFMTSLAGLAVGMYGSVPAILLGVLYGILVRKRCSYD
jgi:hypothetical protein